MKRSRIGDLRMRVVYRLLAGAVAVIAAAVAAVVAIISPDSAEQPGEVTPGQIAAPSAAAPSPGPTTAQSSPPSASSSTSPSGSPSPAASSTPVPDGSAVTAALADPRVPELPDDTRLARLPGKPLSSKRRVQDEKSGVSLIRFGKPWKPYGASPFATKQVLPEVKGAGHRAMLVSCPVPTLPQATMKGTALLAARWTLNHHPRGARIRWTASQPVEGGWLLAYRVEYKVKGKARSSMAAVALTETEAPAVKPAMVFVTIPDSQRDRWRDINTAMSSVRSGAGR
ncbi:hypothetical protein HS041_22130 [Planomonospora sp. ID67723]|uniref:hypothetical protein n=1 Tax=Planomonospora sp. ID67723 TaxID=2738134 RepID=UPI0018C38F1E|nr:hypothetical protein [Planomonospora sp. ID67723]MBG0830462.1 hypothetical protein [Planomonospora sp. ID67723]